MRNLSTQGYAIAFLVAAKIGITMSVADRYGWHRDELYYLASSRHLSLGYVDYPPVTPLLARLDQALFPGSLPGLRLLPVLAGAAVIVIAALIARELGGNRLAQALTGLAVLISPEFIGTNILFQTVSFDQVVWAVACLLFVRLLRGANPREWLWLGLVFGIGLETKYTVIGLGVAMLVGLLVTRQRLFSFCSPTSPGRLAITGTASPTRSNIAEIPMARSCIGCSRCCSSGRNCSRWRSWASCGCGGENNSAQLPQR